MRLGSTLLIASSLALAAAPPVAAQETTPARSAAATTLFTAPLPNIPGQRLTSVLTTFEPGVPLPAHRHAGAVYIYVLEGALRLAVEGQPEQVVHAGESFFEPPGALHTVGISADPDRRAVALTVIVGPDGAPLAQAP